MILNGELPLRVASRWGGELPSSRVGYNNGGFPRWRRRFPEISSSLELFRRVLGDKMAPKLHISDLAQSLTVLDIVYISGALV